MYGQRVCLLHERRYCLCARLHLTLPCTIRMYNFIHGPFTALVTFRTLSTHMVHRGQTALKHPCKSEACRPFGPCPRRLDTTFIFRFRTVTRPVQFLTAVSTHLCAGPAPYRVVQFLDGLTHGHRLGNIQVELTCRRVSNTPARTLMPGIATITRATVSFKIRMNVLSKDSPSISCTSASFAHSSVLACKCEDAHEIP